MKVKIAKDITKYKEKLFFGLNLRQIICLSLALLINIPIYFFLKDYLGDDLTGWIVLIIALPLFLVGWYEKQGLTFEKYILEIIWSYVCPPVRPYKTESEMEGNFKDVEYVFEEESK